MRNRYLLLLFCKLGERERRKGGWRVCESRRVADGDEKGKGDGEEVKIA